MKTFLSFVFIAVLGIFIYSYPLPTPCDNTVEYSLGSIDSRFNVAEDDFLEDIARAEAGWEKKYGKNLFNYTPGAKLKVSLIYDERQYFTSQIGEDKSVLSEKENSLTPNIEDYKKRSEAFKKRTEDFHQRVEYWNSQGGATQEEYEKLVKEQEELQIEAANLNNLARTLDQSAQEYNQYVDKVNQDIEAYNEVIGEKPEGGIYDPRTSTIDIFYNASQDELVHTIAHELGHALGLGHINDPQALMYAQTNTIIMPSDSDMEQLNTLCTTQRPYQVLGKNIEIILASWRAR